MADFEDFLTRLFREGRVVFADRPETPAGPSDEARAILESAYDDLCLDVAGPPVPIDLPLAFAAAEVVRRACWALVCHEDRVEDLAGKLTLRPGRTGPSQHLSVDLTFRYLPRAYRRARSTDPADPLVALLGDLLRGWPLSGVLAGLDEPPTSPPEFGDHPGLALLYAERFATQVRAAWEPAGLARESLELWPEGARLLADWAKVGGDG